MLDKNMFRGQVRLMSPVEMCICMEDDELIRGLSTLERSEQAAFMTEFNEELTRLIERYVGIKDRFALRVMDKTKAVEATKTDLNEDELYAS